MRQVYLNFHGIGLPQRTLEPGEARYWIPADLFAETLHLAAHVRDKAAVRFTFDDGNISDLLIGADQLTKYNITAKFFVLSSRIGHPGSLGISDILELRKMGHEIGSHGADHVDWASLDERGRMREFDEAPARIAKILNTPVTSVAIPFGRYNGRVLSELRKRGHSEVFSSDGGAWHEGQFPIPRTSITSDMTPDHIENLLVKSGPLKQRLRRKIAMSVKKWV